jgi:uncharacterized membrane protein YdbT with pleckstrin-like domain
MHMLAAQSDAGGAVGIPVDRALEILPAKLISDDEVVILVLRPSLWYIPLASLGSIMFVLLVMLLLMWMSTLPWVTWSDGQAVAIGIVLITLRLLWQCLEWWSRVYVLTDRRVIRRKGVLSVSVFEAQLRNIQHTSVFQLLRERLFGLGSIGFATAGSSTFEAFWVMIPQPFSVHRAVVDAIERYGRRS